MYLKKLSFQGFKSFANRTNFEYTGGITAVVGPNGSGKSNVADGIRWVLGEQSIRLLRAKKQEDVVFAGTKERPAVGMAEVLLTLDNSDHWLPLDFAEVEIGRRVYRNGDSEYLLNGSRVRLRDIADLLMKGDVGQNSYTIMGQGLVDEVLSMTPEERRGFLDEAADVKRFRVKINEAQNRLAATRENIERVSLIVTELEPRVAQLGRQAERAGEHSRLSAELTDLLRGYFGHRWNETQNTLVRSRAALDQYSAESQASAERVTALRDQLRALGEEIRKRREAIGRRDSRNLELEGRINATGQAIALDRERHSMVTGRRAELHAEIEAIESEKLGLASIDVGEGRREIEIAEQMDEVKASVTQAREALDLVERDYAAARSRLQELRDGAEADGRRARAMLTDIDRANERLANLTTEAENATPKRRQLVAELKAYGERFLEVAGRVAEAEADLDATREGARYTRERYARVADEMRIYEETANQELRELDHLEGRLDALRRVQAEHDGVAAGTHAVLAAGQALIDGVVPGSLGEPPEVAGVIGLVARQMRVPGGLEAAINAALEGRLHAIVVSSEEAALAAIALLRDRRQGRAQFIALDLYRHSYPLNLQKERGVVGVASKLVRCEKAMQPLIDTLLGRVIVCEDVPTAQRMSRRSLGTCVTLDGTYFEASGVLSGGATGADEGPFVRQRELGELPDKIASLRERSATSRHQLDEARAAAKRLSDEAREAETLDSTVRRNLDGARAEFERERSRFHRLRREMGAFRSRLSEVARDNHRQREQVTGLRATLAEVEARRDQRQSGIAAVEEELKSVTARRETQLRAVSEAGARLAAVEGERRALLAIREQHEKALDRLANQVSARQLQLRNLELETSVIDERLARLARELDAARAETAAAAGEAAPDHDELHRFEAHERQVQEAYSDAQSSSLEVDRRRLDLESEVARAESQLESLRGEMEREGLAADRAGNIISLDQSPAPFESVESPVIAGAALLHPDETRAQVEEIRRRIRRLGPINAEAPEDYRESKERYEFLSGQLQDLADAEAQLREAIAELSVEIRQRFGVTFEQVNRAFGEYFTSFFGGGSASLLLTNPDDPAESGIEIEAQPAGKRIKSLSLLSGGERSLTAVALLFALLTVNPAPFCVLDEVDAALDEANVARFSSALTKLAEKTQFIVITHNRKTVEVADAIYGVSMGRDGVSKVLSLRLSDIPADS